MSAGPAASVPHATANPAGAAPPADRSDALDPSEELVKPSTTAGTLRRLRVWLVLTSLAAGAVSLFVFSRAHAVVDTISNRSAPAVEQADAAYVAIANADVEAVHGLRYAGELGGVSYTYQNDLSAANQSLSRLLADNVAGVQATSLLQLVQDLVVRYNQQVEQAYADLTQHNPLAVVDLYYSTVLSGTLLKSIKDLRDDETSALATQQSSTWLAATGYLVWVPVIVLATALVLTTDALVRRRFRRRLNVGLAAAALALVAMGVLCGLSLWASDGDISDGVNGPLANVTALSDAQVATASRTWQADLYDQLAKACPNGGLCGANAEPGGAPTKTAAPAGQAAADMRAAEDGFARAAAIADAAYIARTVIIALLAVAATVLAVFGLWRRIDEYKFEA